MSSVDRRQLSNGNLIVFFSPVILLIVVLAVTTELLLGSVLKQLEVDFPSVRGSFEDGV